VLGLPTHSSEESSAWNGFFVTYLNEVGTAYLMTKAEPGSSTLWSASGYAKNNEEQPE
jgi:hypothetical protein